MQTCHYKKPKLGTYSLHISQSQPSGFHFLILDFNSCREFETFIESGTTSHIFGPLKDNESEPYLTVFTFLVQRIDELLNISYKVYFLHQCVQ